METVGSRIRYLRKSAGLTQLELTSILHEETEVTRGAVGNWEHDKGISRDNIGAIARKFGVSLDWLQHGTGATPGPEQLRKIRAKFSDFDLHGHWHEDKPVRRPFSTFDPDVPEQRLDPDQQLTVGQHTVSGIPSDASPQIDVRAGMGAGGATIIAEGVPGVSGLTFAAEVVSDYWRLPAEVNVALGVSRRPQNIIILPVQGTSMLPILMEGDFVFVDTRHRIPSPDGIYAMVDEFDSIVVKMLRSADPIEGEDAEPRIEIVSKNTDFPTKRRRVSEVNVVGRVVRRFTADFGRD